MADLCPVCGGATDEGGRFEILHEGQNRHFCSLACLHLFRQYPEVYMGEEEPVQMVMEDSTVS